MSENICSPAPAESRRDEGEATLAVVAVGVGSGPTKSIPRAPSYIRTCHMYIFYNKY